MTSSTAPRSLAKGNASRLHLSEMIQFWERRMNETTDPLTLATHRRIIMELRVLMAREVANAN